MEVMTELALRRQFDEAQRQALASPVKAALARIALQSIIDGITTEEVRVKIGEKDHKPKVDLAEERRAAIEDCFHKRGHIISVPKPAASNTAIKQWKRKGRELFYRPASVELSYEAFMSARGQFDHWTVVNFNDHFDIGWQDATAGYWFLVEMALACPRLNTSWNDLSESIKLLCLEEYAIAYWTHHDLTGLWIDTATTCWLRTRFNQGALSVVSRNAGVGVNRFNSEHLASHFRDDGGRAVEVIKNAV